MQEDKPQMCAAMMDCFDIVMLTDGLPTFSVTDSVTKNS
jgi:hypothetical protein